MFANESLQVDMGYSGRSSDDDWFSRSSKRHLSVGIYSLRSRRRRPINNGLCLPGHVCLRHFWPIMKPCRLGCKWAKAIWKDRG